MSLGYDTRRETLSQLHKAQDATRHILGDAVLALDSSSKCYGAALRQLGVDTRTLRASDYGTVFAAKTGRMTAGRDQAAAAAFERRFPGAGKVQIV
jgi:hypothetical protein